MCHDQRDGEQIETLPSTLFSRKFHPTRPRVGRVQTGCGLMGLSATITCPYYPYPRRAIEVFTERCGRDISHCRHDRARLG